MSAKVAESATGSESPTKKTRSQTNAETSGKKSDSAAPVKKETFQWSTPADEFAEDVESDDSEDGDSDYIDEVLSYLTINYLCLTRKQLKVCEGKRNHHYRYCITLQ